MPNTESTIICGDLNSRIGRATEDTFHNYQGQLLYDWINSHDMTIWYERLAYGLPTFMNYFGSSIIDYFISTTELPYPSLIIRDDLSFDSYHKFMTLSFQASTPPQRLLPPKRALWYLGKLKNEKLRTEYNNHFSHLTKGLIPSTLPSFDNRAPAAAYIEKLNHNLCQAIYQSLDVVCGRNTRQWGYPLQQFWAVDMQEAIELKEHYYRKWRKSQGMNCLKYWNLHQETKARLRRMILK
ncbi:hypothetical protein RMATCC62417_17247 [Rhizopus microsporus]|nr:hypothetical protein RMATCC62417_17247 [Rhizopus microsporus]